MAGVIDSRADSTVRLEVEMPIVVAQIVNAVKEPADDTPLLQIQKNTFKYNRLLILLLTIWLCEMLASLFKTASRDKQITMSALGKVVKRCGKNGDSRLLIASFESDDGISRAYPLLPTDWMT